MSTPTRRACTWTTFSFAISVVTLFLISPAEASLISAGPNGIDAIGLGLTGAGIGVGQVELNRPGISGFDAPANSNTNVTPAGVFEQNFNATANRSTDNHATEVAGVIISKRAATIGVAPAASHYSGADSGPDMISSAATANLIDRINGVRTVNHSFGIGGALNGTSLYTSFIDWSASRYDVLNVIAGNEQGDSANTNIPTDSFNGVVVSMTTQAGGAVFNRMGGLNIFNNLPLNSRRSIDIAAPGVDIQMEARNNALIVNTGTSFAAPHVAGGATLLQQFSQNRRIAAAPRFDADSQRHETMKAVLMNSADKRSGILGMTKTIARTDGDDWITQRAQEVAGTDGPALNRDLVPLDLQMGTGQLNVRRAVKQLTPGEYDPGAVPLIGWDYHTIGSSSGAINRYQISPGITKDGWISVTLAWDRGVTLNETIPGFVNNSFDGETFVDLGLPAGYNAGEPLYDLNGNGVFNQGVSETFGNHTLNDLDLFLVPRGLNTPQAVARSISSIYSVEHIFFQVQDAERYDILVVNPFGSAAAQNYGLAWWTVPEPASVALWASLAVAFIPLRRRASSR